ncbi:MAG: NADH:ubiquinone oxidoreductase [Candidatus Altiarchaeales archaeon ex4484_96]|nr:MAG: NADH:ubiquinone oxidoreductase [Candidatus Altiarchaeales archaeon ex4484_96]
MINSEHTAIMLIAVPLLGAFTTAVFGRVSSSLRNIWVLAILASTELLAVLLGVNVLEKGINVYALGASFPTLTSPEGFPVRIILEVDAMNALISLIACTITLIVVVYCLGFMRESRVLDKAYTLILLLLTGMLGLTLTGDLFNLFVFFEVVSISSAALIAFYVHRGQSLEAAFKYMVISATGALILLFAVAIIYSQYNLLSMAALAASIKYTFLDEVALVLLISAFLLKAGSVPAHMWKPDAYGEAPAPVAVMLLTSALVSLYVLFRITYTVFNPVTPTIGWTLALLGVLSIFLGVSMALIQTKLNRLIAYSAIAEIGFILLGVGSSLTQSPHTSKVGFNALSGGLFHILNDVLDLGLLFLAAGAIYYLTRENNMNRLGGLGKTHPVLGVFFLIGLLAVSGLPPFNGFASKLMIYESVYFFNPLFAIIGILGSILMAAVYVKAFYSVFLGVFPPQELGQIPKSMLAAMGVLALLILVIGLYPATVIKYLITPAADALINPGDYIGGVL